MSTKCSRVFPRQTLIFNAFILREEAKEYNATGVGLSDKFIYGYDMFVPAYRTLTQFIQARNASS